LYTEKVIRPNPVEKTALFVPECIQKLAERRIGQFFLPLQIGHISQPGSGITNQNISFKNRNFSASLHLKQKVNANGVLRHTDVSTRRILHKTADQEPQTG
jgi:hypothetical protein